MTFPLLFTTLLSSAVLASDGPASTGPLPRPTSTPLAVNVSLVPPLSANALLGYRTENAFALDLLVGQSAALRGAQVSGVGSRNGEVRGAQFAGVGNWVDAGAYGEAGDLHGAQFAGAANWTGGSVRGAQVAGALNVAGRESAGAQVAGAANVASALRGLQIAGAVNRATSLVGAQVAGAVNVASDVAGVQIAGAVNHASGDATVQVAPINVAGRASRAQVGVVNAAEEADVSVGVLSWVDRGTRAAAVAATEYGLLAQADTGGRIVYGVLAGGTLHGARPRRYLLGLGIGWRAVDTGSVALDVQATGMNVVDENAWTRRHLSSVRASVAMRVAGPLSVFAGPTVNVLVDRESRKLEPVGYARKVGTDVQLWPGLLAGLRLH